MDVHLLVSMDISVTFTYVRMRPETVDGAEGPWVGLKITPRFDAKCAKPSCN